MYFCAPIRVCEQLRKNAEKIFFLCLKNRITLNSNKKPFLSYYTAHKYKGTRLAQFMNTSFQSKWQDKSIYQYYNQWHRKTFYFLTILAVAVTQKYFVFCHFSFMYHKYHVSHISMSQNTLHVLERHEGKCTRSYDWFFERY